MPVTAQGIASRLYSKIDHLYVPRGMKSSQNWRIGSSLAEIWLSLITVVDPGVCIDTASGVRGVSFMKLDMSLCSHPSNAEAYLEQRNLYLCHSHNDEALSSASSPVQASRKYTHHFPCRLSFVSKPWISQFPSLFFLYFFGIPML